jgi:hypothetical protein
MTVRILGSLIGQRGELEDEMLVNTGRILSCTQESLMIVLGK